MNKRIMVVDDSHFILEIMKEALKQTEFEIVGYARSGEDAINSYESIKPDLITMDIILPGMDGLEAVRIIRERWPEAKVIVASSLGYEETMTEAQKVGAVGFLIKPFEPTQLRAELRKAFGLERAE